MCALDVSACSSAALQVRFTSVGLCFVHPCPCGSPRHLAPWRSFASVGCTTRCSGRHSVCAVGTLPAWGLRRTHSAGGSSSVSHVWFGTSCARFLFSVFCCALSAHVRWAPDVSCRSHSHPPPLLPFLLATAVARPLLLHCGCECQCP